MQQCHKVGYKDAKTWMERRLAGMKSGVPNWAVTALAGEWAGNLGNNITDLDRGIAKIEAANLEKHYERWHVPHLGHMENPRPDGVFIFWGDNSTAHPPWTSVHGKSRTWYDLLMTGKYKLDVCWRWELIGQATLHRQILRRDSKMRSRT
jgi:hypothetical protein